MNITVIMNQSYGKSSENYMKSMIDKSNFIIRFNLNIGIRSNSYTYIFICK